MIIYKYKIVSCQLVISVLKWTYGCKPKHEMNWLAISASHYIHIPISEFTARSAHRKITFNGEPYKHISSNEDTVFWKVKLHTVNKRTQVQWIRSRCELEIITPKRGGKSFFSSLQNIMSLLTTTTTTFWMKSWNSCFCYDKENNMNADLYQLSDYPRKRWQMYDVLQFDR